MKKLRLMAINFELQAIGSFFDKVMNTVELDTSDIVEKYENGDYQNHSDDVGNALFFPEMRAEIAIRAVLNGRPHVVSADAFDSQAD